MKTDWSNVVDLFETACQKYHDQAAFSCLGQTLTFADIDSLSRAFASFLQQHPRLQEGDRIAVQLPNLLQYPVAVFGILRAGMVVVNTNPLYTPREMQHQFRDSGAKALVVLNTLADTAAKVAVDTDINTLIVTEPVDLHQPVAALQQSVAAERLQRLTQNEDGLVSLALRDTLALAAGEEFASVNPAANAIAVLQYTGGTTGVAKGAMLSHGNLVANATQITRHASKLFREGAEIYVTALPLYHIYAFTVHMIALLSKGGHNLLIPNPRDTAAVVDAIKEYRFTGFPGITTLFNSLLHNEAFRQLDFSELKSTSAGGMALTSQVANEWRDLTGVEVAEGYGMTEASPVICSNPPGRIRPGTVGLPVPDTEVKVIDSDGNTLPSATPGELCVRGPQVMQGYWRRPEATAEVLSDDGWLRTGDIATIDADGYVSIVDRLKDMIVVSGFNVYPNEIEDVASSHPLVLECAAIGVPDSASGEAVKLFVVPATETFDAEDLRRFLRSQLTGYKVPKFIETLHELPKTNVGKILRRELR